MSPQSRARWTGLTVIATVPGLLRAQVLQAQLEQAGIEAVLDYESAGPLFGITVGGLKLSQVYILVADTDAEKAQRILDTPPPPDWETELTASATDQP